MTSPIHDVARRVVTDFGAVLDRTPSWQGTEAEIEARDYRDSDRRGNWYSERVDRELGRVSNADLVRWWQENPRYWHLPIDVSTDTVIDGLRRAAEFAVECMVSAWLHGTKYPEPVPEGSEAARHPNRFTPLVLDNDKAWAW